MLRADIEQYMKENGITQIDLVYNKDDQLAVYCQLKRGKLYDYSDHVVNRKQDIWGYLVWSNGSSTKIMWNK